MAFQSDLSAHRCLNLEIRLPTVRTWGTHVRNQGAGMIVCGFMKNKIPLCHTRVILAFLPTETNAFLAFKLAKC